MATIPKTSSLAASGVQIANAIRSEVGGDYALTVPLATPYNVRAVGDAITSLTANQNAFLSALVNRIGRVLLTSKVYENPLKPFKKGMLEYGETVEEIFTNMATNASYSPDDSVTGVFQRVIPDVKTLFHTMNWQKFYKATVSFDQLRQAFLSWRGIEELVTSIVDSLYSGSETDEFITMKSLIESYDTNNKFYSVTIPDYSTTSNLKGIISTIKAYSNKLEFVNTAYNAQGVKTFTKKKDQIILLDAAFDAAMDVEVLAAAFNMDKAEFMGQRVLLDNFGSINGACAAIVDRNWFMVFDNFINMTEIYNPQGLYWNYFYHNWKTFSTSEFANAIIFKSLPVVTSVSVSPATASVVVGTTKTFSAEVQGSYSPSQSVTWSVTGGVTGTTISTAGVLSVDANETATTLTVTATSTANITISGTATVTVTAS